MIKLQTQVLYCRFKLFISFRDTPLPPEFFTFELLQGMQEIRFKWIFYNCKSERTAEKCDNLILLEQAKLCGEVTPLKYPFYPVTPRPLTFSKIKRMKRTCIISFCKNCIYLHAYLYCMTTLKIAYTCIQEKVYV